jgi:hypothetical protein
VIGAPIPADVLAVVDNPGTTEGVKGGRMVTVSALAPQSVDPVPWFPESPE